MKAPYRTPETPAADALAPTVVERLVLTYRAIKAAPGRWWDRRSSGTQVLLVAGSGFVVLFTFGMIVSELDPCRRHVKARVHGVTPDGLPADYDQSWCAEYKPGRKP